MRYCSKPGAEQFSVPPGSAFFVGIYASAFTCGRSFTVGSVPGALISFRVFLVFSLTLFSLYYCYLLYHVLVFLLIILVYIIIVVIIIVVYYFYYFPYFH